MKKILITGNSGYIGSHLSDMLLKKDCYEVHGLDKKKTQISLHKQYYQDIREDQWNMHDSYDCVIHLAAEVAVGRSVKNPILYYTTNTQGTLNVLKNISIKRFIHGSTGSAGPMNNPYGISKRGAEDIVRQFCMDNEIPYTTFRFYNVTGTGGYDPTNPDGLMWNLINAQKTGIFNLFGDDYNTEDGSAVRDYTHVNEICNALILAIEESTNQIENLGHGIGTTVKQMISLYKSINKCDFKVNICPRRQGDLERSVLDNPSKFMQKLYTMEELLKVSDGIS
jgi:UDP-glucose 4-epimerase